MGFTETLTAIFIVLKLTGIITWSWVWVLFPELLAISFYAFIMLTVIFQINKGERK